ncbi:MAG: DNA gyrase subunit A [Candidatus Roizmanbacteria bacterium]|nr:DNA gyrase subunit A [Candidatus Roizmanbacteria bacterium]
MGKIIESRITEEMKKSYLDYAMSVIVARALPDVRDGLKPVQRRILYTMYTLGLNASARFKKSATVVGEVLGKYHPHGDVPVYDALVRMAQQFSMRYPLVRGQGNFGSIDGDPPAAMRYTEVKLEKIAEEIMADYDKGTVDFRGNFDNSLTEPVFLPGKIPNLLLNGAEGIAVGMATKIPPHHLGELIDGLLYTIEKVNFDPKEELDKTLLALSFTTTVEELMTYIKGPDFPTGGILYSTKDILNAYQTGRQSLIVRAVANIEESDKGRDAIIVSELPYQVNKATLIQKIAGLVQDKKMGGIATIRDESDRRGIRVVIEIKKDAVAKKVLNNLFLKTELQTTFPVNMVALVDGIPQTLSLKAILDHYLRHRATVVVKRTRFELAKAKARAHILDGLLIAIDNIDEIVDIIKKSPSEAEAKKRLMTRFKFSDLQAQAILDMQLKRLTALEKDKIQAELDALQKEIDRLETILSSIKNVLIEVSKELSLLKEKFGDKRRTKIIRTRPGEFSDEELIENKEVYVLLTKDGYIKQLPQEAFKLQKRGGKGISAIKTNEGDSVAHILSCTTHEQILFFTNKGKVYQVRVWEIPQSSRQSKGKAIINLIPIEQNERVSAMYCYDLNDASTLKNTTLFFATRRGYVKKTKLQEYANIRSNGLKAITLANDDELLGIEFLTTQSNIFLIGAHGKSIMFPDSAVRPMGRSARGVRGMKLSPTQTLTTLSVVPVDMMKKSTMLIVTQKGHGKLVQAHSFRTQNRGGVGIKAATITDRTGPIIYCDMIDHKTDAELILTSGSGQVVQIPIKTMPVLSRNAQGVIIMRFSEKNDYVATATLVREKE